MSATRNDKPADTTATTAIPATFDYTKVESWSDALQLATEKFGTIVKAHEDTTLGDGFRVASETEKKTFLSGRPLLLMEWNFVPSKWDATRETVEIRLVAMNDNGSMSKWIVTDGGVGICKELKEWTTNNGGRRGGLALDSGFRFSEYPIGRDGKPLDRNEIRNLKSQGITPEMGVTFYLDTNAKLN